MEKYIFSERYYVLKKIICSVKKNICLMRKNIYGQPNTHRKLCIWSAIYNSQHYTIATDKPIHYKQGVRLIIKENNVSYIHFMISPNKPRKFYPRLKQIGLFLFLSLFYNKFYSPSQRIQVVQFVLYKGVLAQLRIKLCIIVACT